MIDSNSEHSLRRLKESLVEIIIITGTVLGTLVFIISMFPYSPELINGDFYLDLFGLTALYITYFNRKKLSIQFKTNVVIFMAYIIFLSDLIDTGLYTQDIVLVVIIPFFSILIYNLRVTFILYAICVASVLIVGYLYQEGILVSSSFDYSTVNYLRWIESALMNSVVIFIITLFLYRFDHKILALFADLKNQNDNLTEREYLLSTITDNFPRSYMSVIDSNFKVLMTGGSEFKAQGIDPTQYNGLSVEEIYKPFGRDILETIRSAYQKTLDGEGQIFQIQMADQHQLYKTMPLPDKNNEITSFLTVVENITESVENKNLIEENLHEKNVLLQEIHHRMKNNLAVVSGLLSLQSLNVEDQNSKFILNKSTNRIMSIAKVHQMLYESKNFNRIPFDKYVNELSTIILDSMNDEMKNIEIETEIDVEFISINHGVPLGIIFNELITNSVKYGFKNQSENKISVSVRQFDNRIEVVYEDNGVGIDDFELESSKSLGFTLIYSLLDQIEATFDFDTKDRFKLRFDFERDNIEAPIKIYN